LRQLNPLGIHLLPEHRQGVLSFLEGSLSVPNGHLLCSEDGVLLHKGLGEHHDGHLLALELSLLALELGLLALELGFLLLERRRSALQLGGLRLDFLSLLLRCGPLDVTLAGGPHQLHL